MFEKNWKQLAAAVINMAYVDIKKFENSKCVNAKHYEAQERNAKSAERFLKGEVADFYRSFFTGE